METKLGRIASKSANTKRPEFTSLYHLINKEMLMQCHRELDGSKAVGIDEVTKVTSKNTFPKTRRYGIIESSKDSR